MEYKVLLEKYRILEEENRTLKEKIIDLTALINKQGGTGSNFQKVAETTQIPNVKPANQLVTMKSKSEEKLKLFSSLFKGRVDVCAKRWKNKPGYSPYCHNDFKPGLCNKPKIKCTECSNSDFAPPNHYQLTKHLIGEHVLGMYPLTTKDTCFLLVMDFDKSTWKDDVTVIRRVCYENNIPVYAERSRSGNGCHLWFFFENEIKAFFARKFGMVVLDLAMQMSNTIEFDSYDRLFPSQDFLQKGGFGNLIAYPLQKEARAQQNSVFIDDDFVAFDDQWQYLSQVVKISNEIVESFIKSQQVNNPNKEVDAIEQLNEVLVISQSDFPKEFVLIREKGIKMDKRGITPKGLYHLRKIASYLNPEFYARQAMRQSTFKTPRVTTMYVEDENHIVVPRGVETKLLELLDGSNTQYSIVDKRLFDGNIDVSFEGELHQKQKVAFDELTKFDSGVLSATTGFGKTVIGAKIITEKKVPTLVLVHRRELANQWKERLEQFIEFSETVNKGKSKSSVIGLLGGGKNSLNGIVDIAIMQSMFEKDKSVKKLISQYGLILVDECHHVSAINFSRILSAANAKYVYGLTATPIRKDGHHPIIFMQCGPLRYKVDAKKEAKLREFNHFLIPRFTSIRMPSFKKSNEWTINEIYQHVCESKDRNELIVSDVEQAINEGRNPLLLTERTNHIEELVKMMENKDFEVIILSGKLKTKARKVALERIKSITDGDRFVILATGKLIGEGFDEARLDTLFMAMPIAWKGTIAQYAGRLNRKYSGKEEVLIYDYVDVHIPVIERMYHKRLSAYRSVGYNIKIGTKKNDIMEVIYDEFNYFKHIVDDIKNAKNNILISSPYIQKKKITEIRSLLIQKYNSGVRITICIKRIDDYSDKQKSYVSQLVGELQLYGVDVIQMHQNRYKFMVVDNETVWYGDINVLGGSLKESSLIRLQNEGLANELFGVISEYI